MVGKEGEERRGVRSEKKLCCAKILRKMNSRRRGWNSGNWLFEFIEYFAKLKHTPHCSQILHLFIWINSPLSSPKKL